MKKFLFLMTLLFSSLVSVNAQIATQNSNALDNIYVGITGGVSTPLDFNSVFPLNANAGLVVGKEFNPYVGVNVEGLAFLNNNHFNDVKTFVKATNVGFNGTLNLSNTFAGYKGTPRKFELGAVAGFGWLHMWDSHANYLSAKTGVDLKFNLGKQKAHTIMITPAVYWNLNKIGNVKFNKNNAQLAVNLTYVYHFKTSNGTHHFKTYDIGAMISEIDRLNGALAECESREPKVVEKIVIKDAPQQVNTAAIAMAIQQEWNIMFAKNSYELTGEAKNTLDGIDTGFIVDLVGLASPEGSDEYNLDLSQKRADAVADYLKARGVKVNTAIGKGVLYGNATNRLVIIKSTNE